MIVTRKERETNQQVARRFNRIMQNSDLLQIARDRSEFVKEITRSMRKKAAVRREKIRSKRELY